MSQSVVLGTRVPGKMDNEIQKAIDSGRYLNRADFLRVAVRSELDRTKEEN